MKKVPIFDGHNDTLVHVYLPDRGGGRSFFKESTKGQIDLPRAKKGGLVGGFFSIFTPPPKSSPERDPYYGFTITEQGYDVKFRSALDYGYADDFTKSVMGFAYQLEKQSSGKVKIVHNYWELERCVENNVLAMVLHFEGAAAISQSLSNLEDYYEKGLRSLGLVWSRPNAFGYGVPFRYPHSPNTGPGLTKAGKNLVAACNALGIVIDLAHINGKGFWDVAKLSKDPLVVSHAGVYSLCSSTRNLTDEQIDAVGNSGGVIGVIFESVNINLKINRDGTPDNNIPLMEIVKHIDYIVNRIGVDHVALGSDFDGAGMPKELRDVSGLLNLIDVLRKNGYDDDVIEKIACKNWLRVIKETWESSL
ncbi:MAG: dipeptidase [Candidatus Aminicenantia bacterium]